MALREVTELLADLLALPSVNPGPREPEGELEGEARVAGYLRDFWQGLAVDCILQEALPGRPNVIARVEAPGRPTLMLQTHMDVVAPTGDAEQAFVPRVRRGRIYGRGACDAKASLAAMMAAVARAATEGAALARGVIMAAAVDEEYCFRGVETMVSSGLRADEVVVGEPTSLAVVVAHKGAIRWRFTLEGRAAHSSTPELGDNAIYRAARLVTALEQYADRLSARPADPILGGPTLSVGVISGGRLPNVVPDACEVLVDRRLVPGEGFDDVEQHLRDFIAVALGPDFAYGLDRILADPPLPGKLNRGLAARAERIVAGVLGDARTTCVRYSSDASKFASIGIPAVLLGPGDVAQAHAADEWIELRQVRAAAEIYYRLITEE